MELIFEILIQFLFEIFGQFIVEILVEFGIRGVFNVTGISRIRNTLLAAIGYIILAAVCGGLSVWILPHQFIQNPALNIAVLILAPVVVGVIMGFRGKYLMKKGKLAIRLDSFSFGFLFALVFGLVRFWLAE